MGSPNSRKVIKCDILIVGTGAAGLAAAVGASGKGLRVVVVERKKYPGGKATATYVGTICGLYLTGSVDPFQCVANGFPKTFCEKLSEGSPYKPVSYKNGLSFLPYKRENFLGLGSSVLSEYTNEVIYDASVSAIEISNRKITEVDIAGKDIAIQPEVFIDASGEVLISGHEQLTDEVYQAAAHVFSLSGLNVDDEQQLALVLTRLLQRGLDNGDIPLDYSRVSTVPGTLNEGSALFKFGVPFETNERSPHGFEDFSRKAVNQILDFLKQSSDIFSNVSLSFFADETGIRTSERYKGLVVLTDQNVLQCEKSANGVARGSWPVEFWKPGAKVEMTYFKKGDYYDIPAGCLQSAEIENLFFAGKNISATERAIASARVIGTCLQTGFAAGVLASGKVTGLDVAESLKEIRQQLFESFELNV